MSGPDPTIKVFFQSGTKHDGWYWIDMSDARNAAHGPFPTKTAAGQDAAATGIPDRARLGGEVVSERKYLQDPVTVEKYTFFIPAGDYRVHCHRHGEPWVVFGPGCNAVSELMSRVEELDAEQREHKALVLQLLDNVEISDMHPTAEKLRRWATSGPTRSNA